MASPVHQANCPQTRLVQQAESCCVQLVEDAVPAESISASSSGIISAIQLPSVDVADSNIDPSLLSQPSNIDPHFLTQPLSNPNHVPPASAPLAQPEAPLATTIGAHESSNPGSAPLTQPEVSSAGTIDAYKSGNLGPPASMQLLVPITWVIPLTSSYLPPTSLSTITVHKGHNDLSIASHLGDDPLTPTSGCQTAAVNAALVNIYQQLEDILTKTVNQTSLSP